MVKQMSEQERRSQPDVRVIFEDAYKISIPFLDPAGGWGGSPMIRHLYIRLRESFPALTQQQISLLVPALQRAYTERNRTK